MAIDISLPQTATEITSCWPAGLIVRPASSSTRRRAGHHCRVQTSRRTSMTTTGLHARIPDEHQSRICNRDGMRLYRHRSICQRRAEQDPPMGYGAGLPLSSTIDRSIDLLQVLHAGAVAVHAVATQAQDLCIARSRTCCSQVPSHMAVLLLAYLPCMRWGRAAGRRPLADWL